MSKLKTADRGQVQREQLAVDVYLALRRADISTSRMTSVEKRPDGTYAVVADEKVYVIEIFSGVAPNAYWRATLDHEATARRSGRRIGRQIARQMMPRAEMFDDIVDLRVHAEIRLFGVARRVPRTWIHNLPLIKVTGFGNCVMHRGALHLVQMRLTDPARYLYDVHFTQIANTQEYRDEDARRRVQLRAAFPYDYSIPRGPNS